MNIQAGKILISSDTMEDLNFKKSVILIAKHDENGTLGFVTNKIFDRDLNELEEFKNSPGFPLYDGGPVDKEHLYFVHRRSDIIENGELISTDVFLGGDFSQAIFHVNSGVLSPADIKIFVGYCGWDSNELEDEIAEGSWTIRDEFYDIIFDNAS